MLSIKRLTSNKWFIAVVVFSLSGVFWTQFTIATMQEKMEKQARLDAYRKVHVEMRKHCQCWFNDTRCLRQAAVVACSLPDFMREVP